MRYSYGLTKAIEKHGFIPIQLPKNAKYEEGKTIGADIGKSITQLKRSFLSAKDIVRK